MKRKHKHTYPRTTKLSVTIHVPKAGNYRCEGNIYSKEFRILDEHGNVLPMGNIHITQSRSRESEARKGPKIICDIPYTGSPSLSLNESLLNFDHVYAVDTNTKYVNNTWLSAGCICYLASCQKDGTEYTYELKWVQQVTSINSFCRYQMEQHVWNAAIAYIQSIIPSNSTVALIVDCDLENIQKYNERSLKIRDAAYIPENFTLIYASADTGGTIANKMIAYSDTCASKVLEQLIAKNDQKDQE